MVNGVGTLTSSLTSSRCTRMTPLAFRSTTRSSSTSCQDFNLLEVSLIDSLAEKSPILLAGDDDQALYDFKSASACHIRSKHGDECPDYESFELPYCSRSTRVIVEAVNDVVGAATERGLLCGRVDKSYKYFECKQRTKRALGTQRLSTCMPMRNQIPWAIEKRIKEIAKVLKTEFSVLVISQTRRQSDAIAGALAAKGFTTFGTLLLTGIVARALSTV